ncbi:alpha/beta hydrolase family protein [Noviherbaspirillum massiliense]|uniref:alpha/beta hydrolase family protein n=1 Tax=Noviherbaspirillum massiliense TaxID=1465823 RepID=UPI0002ECADAA|nr:alpha/beta hydrolase [Noviherbaspirillum massiliense]
MTKIKPGIALLLALASLLLSACGGGSDSGDKVAASGDPAVSTNVPARIQDTRTFSLDPASLPFTALSGTTVETDRWTGILNGAGYRIEVPKNWNGVLVMYAHGYNGPDAKLELMNPPFRRYLIENGYAWAASTFSRNYYDVRAGVEDTNALALSFNRIAAQNQRPLPAPSRVYIVGASMGGHVAAAAVEQETLATAANKMRYNGAVPMCGVVGDTELFNYFRAYESAAEYYAGVPVTTAPTDFTANRGKMEDELWRIYPLVTTSRGDKVKSIVMHLTGGPRPIFDEGFAIKPIQDAIWDTFDDDGTLYGIVAKNIVDTTQIVYQLDDDPALSPEEVALNNAIPRVSAAADANPLRADGVRWVPRVNGQFNVPVVTLHTLGDLYVPFKMEQIYRQRAIANGSDAWLVQRMVRSPAHCDITIAEQIAAFQAMVDWEQRGIKPAGDDVLTPAVVADRDYGCAFTDNTVGQDDQSGLAAIRAIMPSCSGS